jgi:assimilatory nitrate reductase catalytic subunit
MMPVEARGPAQPVDAAFPLALNTGRVRDHWHTLTRTGLAPELCQHAPEPFVEIHPDDAAAHGVVDGALARVQTRHAEAVALAVVSDRQRPGSLFMPMHWTAVYAPAGRANRLVAAQVDPRSGQPEFKHTPSRIRPYRETWRGFFLSRDAVAAPDKLDLVWRRIPQAGCQLHEFAGRGDDGERDLLRRLLLRGATGEPLRFEDASAGALREAILADGRLDRVFFATRQGRLPPRDWLIELFGSGTLDAQQRAALLIGRAPGRMVQASPVVCACLGVRAQAIQSAIAEGAVTLDAVSQATGAASNCGSCRPEVARMLALETADAA